MTTAILTEHQAARLKAALWHGEPGEYVATNFGCSLALVRSIARGYSYSAAPWPDGSTGPIKHSQLKRIARARTKARREVFPQITRTMNARVRAILEATE